MNNLTTTSRALAVCLAVLTMPLAVFGAGKAGSSGGQFLKIGADAASAALGDAGAVMTGARGMFVNPAGIGTVENLETTFSHTSWIQDIGYSNAAVAKRVGPQVFGLAVNYLSMPSIDSYNNLGQKLSDSYNVSDMAVSLGYSRDLLERFRFGADVKYISSKLESESAAAFAIDLGAQYTLIPDICDIGLAVQNLGTEMKYRNEGDPLPLNCKLGGKYSFIMDDQVSPQGITLYSDVNMMNDTGLYSNVGAELYRDFQEQGKYLLRAGYKTNLDEKANGICLGFGINFRSYTLDYAYASLGDLGQSHRVSFSLKVP